MFEIVYGCNLNPITTTNLIPHIPSVAYSVCGEQNNAKTQQIHRQLMEMILKHNDKYQDRANENLKNCLI